MSPQTATPQTATFSQVVVPLSFVFAPLCTNQDAGLSESTARTTRLRAACLLLGYCMLQIVDEHFILLHLICSPANSVTGTPQCDCRCFENTADNSQRTKSAVDSVAINPQAEKDVQGQHYAYNAPQGASCTANQPPNCPAQGTWSTTGPPGANGRSSAAAAADKPANSENRHHARCHSDASTLAACKETVSPSPPHAAPMQVSSSLHN